MVFDLKLHNLDKYSLLPSGKIVYKQEPLPAESPLWGCDNVLMTAHNADLTADYFSLGWKVWLENLAAYRSSATLATPVNTAEGY